MIDIIAQAAQAAQAAQSSGGEYFVWRIITPLIAGVVTALIGIAGCKVWLKGLAEKVAELQRASDQHAESIGALREARQKCKAEAAQAYATRGDLAGSVEGVTKALDKLSDTVGANVGELHKRIDQVSDKINPLGEGLARLRGEIAAQGRVQT